MRPPSNMRCCKKSIATKSLAAFPYPPMSNRFWAQHKYSVMARSPQEYQRIGRAVVNKEIEFAELALTLTEILREAPNEGRLWNALQHMWGYVANEAEETPNGLTALELLRAVQREAKVQECGYLMGSTALSELAVWC